jgi:hypothetical protein
MRITFLTLGDSLINRRQPRPAVLFRGVLPRPARPGERGGRAAAGGARAATRTLCIMNHTLLMFCSGFAGVQEGHVKIAERMGSRPDWPVYAAAWLRNE